MNTYLVQAGITCLGIRCYVRFINEYTAAWAKTPDNASTTQPEIREAGGRQAGS